MKDITFCINKECEERKSCFRAEENYPDTNAVNSYAMFNCDNEKHFEPIPCWICGSDMNHVQDINMEALQGHRFNCTKCGESVIVTYNAPFLKERKQQYE